MSTKDGKAIVFLEQQPSRRPSFLSCPVYLVPFVGGLAVDSSGQVGDPDVGQRETVLCGCCMCSTRNMYLLTEVSQSQSVALMYTLAPCPCCFLAVGDNTWLSIFFFHCIYSPAFQ